MRKSSAISWCIISAILFGASTPASKIVLGGIPPVTLAGLLYLGSAIIILPFGLKGQIKTGKLSKANFSKIGGAVVFGGILGPILLLLGLRLAESATVSLWLTLESVATAIIAWLFFREHLHLKTMLAIILIVTAGFFLASASNFGNLHAIILVALACVCWGIDNNLTSVIDSITPLQMTVIKGLVAGIFNLALGFTIENTTIQSNYILFALIIGGLSYGVSIALYIMGSHELGAVRSQLIFSSAPLAGVILSWFALKESILISQIIAALLMGLGIILMTSEKHAHSHRHVPEIHTHLHSHDDDHHDHHHPGLPPSTQHIHPHEHDSRTHSHVHHPDLHHRHTHE